MAKLSGVKTLDMVGGEVTKVEYNGEVYEKVGTDSPKVGDIGMIIDSWGSLFNGEFYEVERVYSRSSCETYHVLDEIKHKVGKVQDEDTMFFRKQVSLKVGDKVRLTIPEGKRPINGWGDARNGDVGVIESVQGESLSINFPDHDYWYGYISEVTKVEESPKTSGAKDGDIIEMTSDCIWHGYDEGDRFTVKVDRRGPYIYDNDGDRRRIDKIPHIEYKIVKEAEEAPKLDPKPLFAKVNRPNNEPIEGDYVEFTDIHVGYISSGHKYAVHSDDDGDLYFFDDDGDDMSVVDPEWTVKNIYVKYSQEQADKEPKVGDKVLVVNPNITFDRYEKGDILTVSEVDSVPHAPRPNIEVVEIDLYLFKEEVIVLTSDQVGEEEEKESSPKFSAGDYIVNNYGTVGVVTEVRGDTLLGEWLYNPEREIYHSDMYYNANNCPRHATKEEISKALGIDSVQVGDKVEVLAEDNLAFTKGEQFIVAELADNLVIDSEGFCSAKFREGKPRFKVVEKAVKEPTFTEGDVVVITGNTNNSRNKVGDVGVVGSDGVGDYLVTVDVPERPDGIDIYGNYTKPSEMRHATPEEKAEFERKQEQAKVNPEGIEEGDLVLIKSLDGSAACGFYEGAIYIVGNYEKRMGRAGEGRIAIKDGEGNFGYIDEANVKLVAKAADLHV